MSLKAGMGMIPSGLFASFSYPSGGLLGISLLWLFHCVVRVFGGFSVFLQGGFTFKTPLSLPSFEFLTSALFLFLFLFRDFTYLLIYLLFLFSIFSVVFNSTFF